MTHSMQARCRSLTKSANAADLLATLYLMWKKSRNNSKGKRWVIFTREEMLPRTGLTIDQYKRAIKHLVRGNLVLLEHHPHKYKPEVFRANWLTIPEHVHNQLGQNSTQPCRQRAGRSVRNSSNTLEEDTPEESGQINADLSVQTNTNFTYEQKGEGKEEERVREHTPPRVTVQRSSDLNILLNEFGKLWWSYQNESQIQRKWSAKDKSLAEEIVRAVPPEELIPMSTLILSEWCSFTEYALRQKGWRIAPEEPTILFLWQTYECAVNYYRSEQKSQREAQLLNKGFRTL